MTRIAFLGLGAMGARMALRLQQAGQQVTFWNRTPNKAESLQAAGAAAAFSPDHAVVDAEIVISMVRDDTASRSVWLDERTGAARAVRPGTICIECSTLTPLWIEELSRHLHSSGAALLDAPVVGSRPQAEAGQLVFLAGGDAGNLQGVTPLLLQMGSAVHHVGAVGAGTTMKLAANALLGIQVAAMAELLGMLNSAGIASARAVEILGGLPITSPAARTAGQSMAQGMFATLFPVNLLEKDLAYARTVMPEDRGMPLTDGARSVMQAAMASGLGEENMSAVVKLYL